MSRLVSVALSLTFFVVIFVALITSATFGLSSPTLTQQTSTVLDDPGFTVAITPSTFVLTSAITQSWQLAVTPTNAESLNIEVRNATSDVSLGVPTGLVASIAPVAFDFELVVRRSLPAGEYAINVEVKGNGFSPTFTIPISVPVPIVKPVNLFMNADPLAFSLSDGDSQDVYVGVSTDSEFRHPYTLAVTSSHPSLTATTDAALLQTNDYFYMPVTRNGPLPNGNHAITVTSNMSGSSRSVVLDIVPNQYVYLPTVMDRYCTGPIVDRFDQNTGWPTSSSSGRTYKVQNGRYEVSLDAGRTVILTRGDAFETGSIFGGVEGYTRLVKFDTTVEVGDGASALVWDIENSVDGLSFSAFEVIPAFDVWVEWRYDSNDGGWSLIERGDVTVGNGPNRIAMENVSTSADKINLTLNGATMTSVYMRSAPIGIMARAWGTNSDLYIDDYVVVGPYCPFPEARSGDNTSHVVVGDPTVIDVEALGSDRFQLLQQALNE